MCDTNYGTRLAGNDSYQGYNILRVASKILIGTPNDDYQNFLWLLIVGQEFWKFWIPPSAGSHEIWSFMAESTNGSDCARQYFSTLNISRRFLVEHGFLNQQVLITIGRIISSFPVCC